MPAGVGKSKANRLSLARMAITPKHRISYIYLLPVQTGNLTERLKSADLLSKVIVLA